MLDFESVVVFSMKFLSVETGEGGGDSWGELAGSITLISLPIRPAVSATIAESSASSSSSSSDDDDDEDDVLDEDEEDDDDEADEDEEDWEDKGDLNF